MKKTLLFLFLSMLWCFSACTKDDLAKNYCETSNESVDILSFDSIDSFQQVMMGLANNTIPIGNISPNVNLLDVVTSFDYRSDPILRYELRDFRITRDTQNSTYYESSNYEELVPDENLASLLNAKGEIEIDGTIYKISERGTYMFESSLKDEFDASYAIFEESEGQLIDTLTYQLADGIVRYATFEESESETFMAPDYFEEPEDEAESPTETRIPTIVSPLQNLNFNDYPVYNSSAKTVAGKILQSLIGRNKSIHYNFTNKKRFSSKFFYYDYLFWSSIGILTKMQKKTFGIWTGTYADDIYSGWGDVMTETELKGNILEYPTKTKAIALKSNEYDTILKKNQITAIAFGLTKTDQDLQKAIGNGLKSLFNLIKSKTGTSVSDADKLCLIGPEKIYTIHLSSGHSTQNEKAGKVIFYRDFSLGIDLDALDLPSSWLEWASAILEGTYELPNTKLCFGKIHTAVKYGDKIGAMTIYKTN